VPDAAGAVVGDEEAAVVAYSDANRTAPDLAVGSDEAGEEVVVLAGGFAVFHGDGDDFVAGAVEAVPGAVLGGEGIACIVDWERLDVRRAGFCARIAYVDGEERGIEEHLKRGHVGLDEDVGCADGLGDVGALAVGLVAGEGGGLHVGAGACRAGVFQARVVVAAHVVPGPAEEAAFGNGGDVVGNEVVAEVVALVGGAPKLVADGVDGLADTVADAMGVDLEELTLGGEFEDVGAVELFGRGVCVVDVGAGAYGDEHLRTVTGEDDVAGPVAAAAQLGEAGELRNDLLGWARGYEIAGLVGEADDGVRVADVDPVWVDGWVEGDAEGEVEAGGEGGDLLRFAVRTDAAEDEDLVAVGVGHEDIAVRRGAEETRLPEDGWGRWDGGRLIVNGGRGGGGREVSAGVKGDLEAGRRDRPCVAGSGDEVRAVVDGFFGFGLGEVGEGDLVADAGMLLVPVGEGGLAGEDGLLGEGADGGERSSGEKAELEKTHGDPGLDV